MENSCIIEARLIPRAQEQKILLNVFPRVK